jgi:hypothetical protein
MGGGPLDERGDGFAGVAAALVRGQHTVADLRMGVQLDGEGGAAEASLSIRIGDMHRGQHLNRHRPVKPCVEGAEHLSHAARANFFKNLVVSNRNTLQVRPRRSCRREMRSQLVQGTLVVRAPCRQQLGDLASESFVHPDLRAAGLTKCVYVIPRGSFQNQVPQEVSSHCLAFHAGNEVCSGFFCSSVLRHRHFLVVGEAARAIAHPRILVLLPEPRP